MKNIFGKEFDQVCETHTIEVVTRVFANPVFHMNDGVNEPRVIRLWDKLKLKTYQIEKV